MGTNKVDFLSTLTLHPDVSTQINKLFDELSDDPVVTGIFNEGKGAWYACGSKLIAVDIQGGSLLSSYDFSSNSSEYYRITCGIEFKILSPQGSLLIIGALTESGGSIAVYNPYSTQVVRYIRVNIKVNSMCIVQDGTLSPIKLNVLLDNMSGVIAAGSTDGEIVLIDLGRVFINRVLDWQLEYLKDETNPSKLVYLDSRNDDNTMILNKFKMCTRQGNSVAIFLNDGSIGLTGQLDEGNCISSMFFSAECSMLFVGYIVGAWQMWSIAELKHLYTMGESEVCCPVHSFVVLEPCDDPYHLLYVWVTQQAQYKGEFPVCSLFVLYFDKKVSIGDLTYYTEISRVSQKFEMDVGSRTYSQTDHSGEARIISCSNVVQSLPKRDPTGVSVSDGENIHLRLIALVWEVRYGTENGTIPENQVQTYITLFDLNQWYKSQMPSVSQGDPSEDKVYLHTISAGRCKLYETYLKPFSFSCYTSIYSLESHYYPSAISFEFLGVSKNNILHGKCLGIQEQWFSKMNQSAERLLLNPVRAYQACLEAGLHPVHEEQQFHSLNLSDLPTVSQRDFALTVCLENNHTEIIQKCADSWYIGSHVIANCSLSYLLTWLWETFSLYKRAFDGYCVVLYNQSGTNIEPYDRIKLEHCQFIAFKIHRAYKTILDKYSNYIILDHTEQKLEAMELILFYMNLVTWLVSVDVLPEKSSTGRPATSLPYMYETLKNFYTERRERIRSLSDKCQVSVPKSGLLLIDLMLSKYAPKLASQWSMSLSPCYPPPSVQAVTRISLLTKVDPSKKHAILLYFLLDLIDRIESDEYEESIERILKYRFVFKLSESESRIIQAFWFIDHNKLEEGIRCIIDNSVLSSHVEPWQHRTILKILIIHSQYKLALQYLRVRKPNLHEVEDLILEINLLVANDLISEAFHLQRRQTQFKDTLAQEFFIACEQFNKLKSAFSMQFNDFEEDQFLNFLKSGRVQNAYSMKIYYYITRARYLEAIDLHEKCRPMDSFNDTETLTRDKIIKGLSNSIPGVSKQLGVIRLRHMKLSDSELLKQGGPNLQLLSALFKPDVSGSLKRYSSTDIFAASLLQARLIDASRKRIQEQEELDRKWEEKHDVELLEGINRKRGLEERDLATNDGSNKETDDAPKAKRHAFESSIISHSVFVPTDTPKAKCSEAQKLGMLEELIRTPVVGKLTGGIRDGYLSGEAVTPEAVEPTVLPSSILKSRSGQKRPMSPSGSSSPRDWESPRKVLRFTLPGEEESQIPSTSEKQTSTPSVQVQFDESPTGDSIKSRLRPRKTSSVSGEGSKVSVVIPSPSKTQDWADMPEPQPLFTIGTSGGDSASKSRRRSLRRTVIDPASSQKKPKGSFLDMLAEAEQKNLMSTPSNPEKSFGSGMSSKASKLLKKKRFLDLTLLGSDEEELIAEIMQDKPDVESSDKITSEETVADDSEVMNLCAEDKVSNSPQAQEPAEKETSCEPMDISIRQNSEANTNLGSEVVSESEIVRVDYSPEKHLSPARSITEEASQAANFSTTGNVTHHTQVSFRDSPMHVSQPPSELPGESHDDWKELENEQGEVSSEELVSEAIMIEADSVEHPRLEKAEDDDFKLEFVDDEEEERAESEESDEAIVIDDGDNDGASVQRAEEEILVKEEEHGLVDEEEQSIAEEEQSTGEEEEEEDEEGIEDEQEDDSGSEGSERWAKEEAEVGFQGKGYSNEPKEGELTISSPSMRSEDESESPCKTSEAVSRFKEDSEDIYENMLENEMPSEEPDDDLYGDLPEPESAPTQESDDDVVCIDDSDDSEDSPSYDDDSEDTEGDSELSRDQKRSFFKDKFSAQSESKRGSDQFETTELDYDSDESTQPWAANKNEGQEPVELFDGQEEDVQEQDKPVDLITYGNRNENISRGAVHSSVEENVPPSSEEQIEVVEPVIESESNVESHIADKPEQGLMQNQTVNQFEDQEVYCAQETSNIHESAQQDSSYQHEDVIDVLSAPEASNDQASTRQDTTHQQVEVLDISSAQEAINYQGSARKETTHEVPETSHAQEASSHQASALKGTTHQHEKVLEISSAQDASNIQMSARKTKTHHNVDPEISCVQEASNTEEIVRKDTTHEDEGPEISFAEDVSNIQERALQDTAFIECSDLGESDKEDINIAPVSSSYLNETTSEPVSEVTTEQSTGDVQVAEFIARYGVNRNEAKSNDEEQPPAEEGPGLADKVELAVHSVEPMEEDVAPSSIPVLAPEAVCSAAEPVAEEAVSSTTETIDEPMETNAQAVEQTSKVDRSMMTVKSRKSKRSKDILNEAVCHQNQADEEKQMVLDVEENVPQEVLDVQAATQTSETEENKHSELHEVEDDDATFAKPHVGTFKSSVGSSVTTDPRRSVRFSNVISQIPQKQVHVQFSDQPEVIPNNKEEKKIRFSTQSEVIEPETRRSTVRFSSQPEVIESESRRSAVRFSTQPEIIEPETRRSVRFSTQPEVIDPEPRRSVRFSTQPHIIDQPDKHVRFSTQPEIISTSSTDNLSKEDDKLDAEPAPKSDVAEETNSQTAPPVPPETESRSPLVARVPIPEPSSSDSQHKSEDKGGHYLRERKPKPSPDVSKLVASEEKNKSKNHPGSASKPTTEDKKASKKNEHKLNARKKLDFSIAEEETDEVPKAKKKASSVCGFSTGHTITRRVSGKLQVSKFSLAEIREEEENASLPKSSSLENVAAGGSKRKSKNETQASDVSELVGQKSSRRRKSSSLCDFPLKHGESVNDSRSRRASSVTNWAFTISTRRKSTATHEKSLKTLPEDEPLNSPVAGRKSTSRRAPARHRLASSSSEQDDSTSSENMDVDVSTATTQFDSPRELDESVINEYAQGRRLTRYQKSLILKSSGTPSPTAQTTSSRKGKVVETPESGTDPPTPKRKSRRASLSQSQL